MRVKSTFIYVFRFVLKIVISFVMSVCPSARIFMIFGIFRKSVHKIQVLLKSDKNNGTLHEDLCTFMIIPR
jgi:hypothetical protein